MILQLGAGRGGIEIQASLTLSCSKMTRLQWSELNNRDTCRTVWRTLPWIILIIRNVMNSCHWFCLPVVYICYYVCQISRFESLVERSTGVVVVEHQQASLGTGWDSRAKASAALQVSHPPIPLQSRTETCPRPVGCTMGCCTRKGTLLLFLFYCIGPAWGWFCRQQINIMDLGMNQVRI